MGFLSRLFGRSKPERAAVDTGEGNREIDGDATKDGSSPPEPPATGARGTLLRGSGGDGASPQEKPPARLTALKIAEQGAWEVKSLRPWQPGEVILDTYEVEDVLSGGMGHVYIVTHRDWRMKVAIKAPNQLMLSERDLLARVLREADSWTKLGLHPHIAYCYHVRRIEGVPHIYTHISPRRRSTRSTARSRPGTCSTRRPAGRDPTA